MKKFRFGRLIAVLVIIVLCLGIGFTAGGAGVFFSRLSNGTYSYNTITEEQLKANLPMNGNIYKVIDCIVEEYSETTSSSGSTDRTVESYYYVVPFEENKLIIVKSKEGSDFEYQMDELYNYFQFDEETSLLTEGATVDGVLVKNDSEVVEIFEEWKDEYYDYYKKYFDMDISKFTVVDYTIDCTETVSSLCHSFYIGVAILLAFVGVIVLIVVLYKKQRANNQFAPMGGYNQPMNGFGQGGFNQNPNGFNQNGFNQNPNGFNQNGFNQNPNGFNQNGFDQNQNNFGQNGFNQNQNNFGQNGFNQTPNNFGQNNYAPSNIPQMSNSFNNQDNSQQVSRFIPQQSQPTNNNNNTTGGSSGVVSLKKEDR